MKYLIGKKLLLLFSIILVLAFSIPLGISSAQTNDETEIQGYSVVVLAKKMDFPTAVAYSGGKFWVAEAGLSGDRQGSVHIPATVKEIDWNGAGSLILSSSNLTPGMLVPPITGLEYNEGWLWITHRQLNPQGKYVTGISRFQPGNPIATFTTTAVIQTAVDEEAFLVSLTGGAADIEPIGNTVAIVEAGEVCSGGFGVYPGTGRLLVLIPSGQAGPCPPDITPCPTFIPEDIIVPEVPCPEDGPCPPVIIPAVPSENSPSTITEINASPTIIGAGESANLTVTEENDGDVELTGPRVIVNGGASETTLEAPPGSGDTNSDGVLDPGETWQWVISSGAISENTTFTATGNGTDPDGNAVTYPGDPDERASVQVTIMEEENQGWTPGYWKNHTDDWVGYTTSTTLGSIFSIPAAFSEIEDDTFLEALDYSGGPEAIDAAKLLLHNAVAALLNAAHPEINYYFAQDFIVDEVNNALGVAYSEAEVTDNTTRAIWYGQGEVNDVYQDTGAGMADTVIFSLYFMTGLLPGQLSPAPDDWPRASGWFTFSFDGRTVTGWVTEGYTIYQITDGSGPKQLEIAGKAFYQGKLYDCNFYLLEWPPGGFQTFTVSSLYFPPAPEISLWSSHTPGLYPVECTVRPEETDVTTITQISASPLSLGPGESANVTVTEENDGDVELTGPQVVVNDGTSDIVTLEAPPDSGDTDSNGILGPGETWQWSISYGALSENTTFTATGYGTDPDGNVITYPGDPDEQDSVQVTVSPASSDNATTTITSLISIGVEPESPDDLEVGGTLQFTATGTYSDNSTADITSEVTWTSSDIAVATIDPAGLATGVSAGSTNITASLSEVTSPAIILIVVAP